MKDTGEILAEILVGGELKVHLIGVAGSGMSGIAGLLLALGHTVSGSDKARNPEVARLQSLGLQFHQHHLAENIADADLVIYSSAIRPGNPEYDEAIRTSRNLVRRADALAAIMNCKKGIIVCGMHGKTTTSSMAAHVLRTGGMHPSHYVGAEIPILGTNAHWDTEGEFFVAEGDESDGTLAFYHPEHAIVLNIEEEHLDYYENLAAIELVFNQLLSQTRGHVFYCGDDPHATRICSVHPGAISYGESRTAYYRYDDVHAKDFQSHFRVLRGGEALGAITLNVPGRHNISNALAAIALATELGVPFAKIAEALETFRGARRRFEIKYRSERYMIVDDYGHHPSEIRATLATAKNTGRKRVLCMFQPHRYSRTQALQKEFGGAFDHADRVIVTDVYAASETPLPGVSGQTIADAISAHGHRDVSYQPRLDRLHCDMGHMLAEGDLVLSLGAGNVHEQLAALAAELVIVERLKEIVGPDGDVKLSEPLAKHTTLRVGGPAQFWVEVRTEEAFANLIRFCRRDSVPLFVIGRGSNLLVREGGIHGVVVHPSGGEFDRVEVSGLEVTAGVGAKLKEIAYAGKASGIGGFEWMEGIPGAVGGGLRMNAGAMGAQTFDQVVRVRYLDREGVAHEKTPAELEVHYRHVPSLQENFAVSAVFRGEKSSAEEIVRRLDASQEKRRTTQPAAKSAGCIFKNPAACPAGKLVDELGLKGSRVGDARVSDVHGNFIVNDGAATAAEVLELIGQIQATARKERGIELETEVQIVGEDA